jgi:hypothetical protein
MKYNVSLEATVEAASAEAAEQMVFDKAAGDVDVTAVPTKEWLVSVDYTSCLTFRVTVHAESAEDAESKADELVAKASFFDGIPGVLDLAEFGHVLTDRIEAYDAEPADDDEKAEPTEPATATETSAA